MSLFSGTAVGMGTATALATAMLTATPSAAHAQSASRLVVVPCSVSSLNTAITTANGLESARLRLSRTCTYNIITPAGISSGLPRITGNITLLGGPRTTIRRDPSAPTNFRIIDVADGAKLGMQGIAVQNGNAPTGGGILNEGDVTLVSVTLSGNTATTGDGGGFANASAGSKALIIKTLISGNTSAGGSGIANSGTVRLSGSRITSNETPNGGGGGVLTNENAKTTLYRSTIDRNSAGFAGGGILNFGVTELDRTLVAYNKNAAENGFPGGGIYNVTENIPTPGVVTARRSAIRANEPTNCHPAGTISGCATP